MRFLSVLAVLLGFATAAHAAAPSVEKPVAVLRALDKATARVEEIDVQTERPYKFGSIIIMVRSCRVTPIEETPESAAFIEVSEIKPAQGEKPVFKGWMFASSPALSAMEHPVYDLWVMGCKDVDAPAAPVPAPAPAPVPAAQPKAPAKN